MLLILCHIDEDVTSFVSLVIRSILDLGLNNINNSLVIPSTIYGVVEKSREVKAETISTLWRNLLNLKNIICSKL